jgi:hypothetical protein
VRRAGIALADSLDQSTSPPQPERYRQDRLLFSFLVEGLSCIECFYYGFYFVGAMIDASAFDTEQEPKRVTTHLVVQRYRDRFPADEMTRSLTATDDSTEIEAWRCVRNVLAHRASPGRAFFAGSPDADWLGEPLSGSRIRERRLWLAETTQALLGHAVGFVQRQVV